MSDEVENELTFLIAKFLKLKFPEIADSFIQKCEEKKQFPSRIFAKNPTFEELDKDILYGMPNDQLLQLIKRSIPNSNFPSILASKKIEIKPINQIDSLMYQLGSPVEQLYKFNPSHRISGHFDSCFCIAIDRSSSILVTGADDFVLKVWKLPEITLLKSYVKLHTKEITEVIIHPLNTMFASSSYDGLINIISLSESKIIQTIENRTGVIQIKFSPCGNYLAAACLGRSVKIFKFDGNNFSEYLVFDKMESDPDWLSFSPGGQFLAVSGDNGLIYVIHITMKLVTRLEGHSKNVVYIAFSRNSPMNIISLASEERSVKLWTVENDIWGSTKTLSSKLPGGNRRKLIGCCWNADDTRVVAISPSNLYAWDSSSMKTISICQHETFLEYNNFLAANPVFPNIVFVGTTTGNCSLWDIESGKIIAGHALEIAGRINCVVWSNDGLSAYTVDDMGGITKFSCANDGVFKTTEMFFAEEIFEGVEPSDLIVDQNNVPLDPQPSLKLNLKKIKLAEQKTDEFIELLEKNLTQIWRKNGILPLKELKLRMKVDNKLNEEEDNLSDDNVQITSSADRQIFDLENKEGLTKRQTNAKVENSSNSDSEEEDLDDYTLNMDYINRPPQKIDKNYKSEPKSDRIERIYEMEASEDLDDFQRKDFLSEEYDSEDVDYDNSEMDDFIVDDNDMSEDHDDRTDSNSESDDISDSYQRPAKKKVLKKNLPEISDENDELSDETDQKSKKKTKKATKTNKKKESSELEDSDFEDVEEPPKQKKKLSKHDSESDLESEDEKSSKKSKKDSSDLEFSEEEKPKHKKQAKKLVKAEESELESDFEEPKKKSKKLKQESSDLEDSDFEKPEKKSKDNNEPKEINKSQIEDPDFNEEEEPKKKSKRKTKKSKEDDYNPTKNDKLSDFEDLENDDFQNSEEKKAEVEESPRRRRRHRSHHENEPETQETQETPQDTANETPKRRRHRHKSTQEATEESVPPESAEQSQTKSHRRHHHEETPEQSVAESPKRSRKHHKHESADDDIDFSLSISSSPKSSKNPTDEIKKSKLTQNISDKDLKDTDDELEEETNKKIPKSKSKKESSDLSLSEEEPTQSKSKPKGKRLTQATDEELNHESSLEATPVKKATIEIPRKSDDTSDFTLSSASSLSSDSEDSHQNIPNWMITTRNNDPFIFPQQGMRFVLLKLPFERYKKSYQQEFTPPYVLKKTLGNVEAGIITDIVFRPNELHFGVSLDAGTRCMLSLPMPNSPGYLVPEDSFKASQKVTIKTGQTLIFRKNGQRMTGIVESVDDSGKNDRFESIGVVVEGRFNKISPWDVMNVRHQVTEQQKQMQALLTDYKNLSGKYQSLSNLSNYKKQTKMGPMSTKIIIQRIINNWYLTIDMLKRDTSALIDIANNSLSTEESGHFNEDVNAIFQKIKQLFKHR
ncbi:hypothetical protein TVAG_347270 [Trichomonas vaginalis G3]|uniref:Uncharacterized protein n=1 Tax=Trichomonas vaginalis (strain ATCC PRA-98 / G3) TaxID=412133 RepID=A2FSH3_TRIV3|nr:regulation of cell shape [Trichomonas vaginalis G3]EAX92144.1 hypothetical protein TVAG_347270 [Trichomonas vaginalis G3]KAI5510184.1 regulation of cell shape [Trichomonas vaginalis G3]|eukprot:XP_001305074.1 hypothetical protein [Trichomonas vaginalis G3]